MSFSSPFTAAVITALCIMLVVLWKKLSEKDRRIAALERRSRITPNSSNIPSLDMLSRAENVLNQWRTLFETTYDERRGPGGAVFLGWLKKATEVASKNVFHSPTFAIVQASGCGKSRLIREAAQIFPFLYVCCASLGQQCYPPPLSSVLRQFLLGPLESTKTEESELRKGGYSFLGRLLSLGIMAKRTNKNLTPARWFDFQAFEHHYATADLLKKAAALAQDSPLASLVKKYAECCKLSSRPIISFVVDEAAGLFGRGSDAYRAVRRVIKDLTSLRVAETEDFPLVNLVFLSTESRVSNFSPVVHLDPSLRGIGRRGFDLYPPLTLVCNPLGFFKSTTVSVAESDSLTELASLGRPLWCVAFEKMGGNGLLDYAELKLSCGVPARRIFDSTVSLGVSTYVLAIASASFALSFSARRIPAEELTAKGMVFLQLVEENRETLWLSAIPEPILGIAALQVLKVHLGKVLNGIRSEIDFGLDVRGDLDEILTRALLVVARPSYTILETAAFLSSFAPPFLAPNIQRLKRTFTAFSHAACAKSDITRSLLYVSFRSNAFLSSKRNQPSFDIVIPVVKSDNLHDELREENMTGVFIEVKNRSAPPVRTLRTNFALPLLSSGRMFLNSREFEGNERDYLEIAKNNADPRSADMRLLIYSMELLEKLGRTVDALGLEDAVLVNVQLELGCTAGWAGLVGKHEAFVFNPLGGEHLSDNNREICKRFCRDAPENVAQQIYERTVEAYSVDKPMAQFGSTVLRAVATPMETRLAELTSAEVVSAPSSKDDNAYLNA